MTTRRYLQVNGAIYGTGLRDTAEEEYVEANEIGLSEDLALRVSAWLTAYQEAHFSGGYDNSACIDALDREGVGITKSIRRELPDSKVEY